MIAMQPARIAIVAGEESGDLLGADMIAALGALLGRPIELVGVGGRHLRAAGLSPLFDGSEIALMGISAVVRRLPRLMRRISQTADAVVRANPDCLVTIDSPDFGLRVARKVRAADPSIPIVHYVCPSVWAWRPGRAKAMAPYVDRILCVLPFEPEVLERLGGPKGVYVGHRLTSHPGILAARAAQAERAEGGDRKRLLVLPGSRSSEVKRLLPDFGATVAYLAGRGYDFDIVMPTVPHVEPLVRAGTASWSVPPEIITNDARKWQIFGEADAALAASGTVSLELALSGVPMISCYRADPLLGPVITRMVTTWSASLPNLIAGWPAVSEHYDAQIRPERLAREIEQLWAHTPARAAQRFALACVARNMATDIPAGERAAEVVASVMRSV